MKITVLYNLVKSVTVGRSQDILADVDTVKTAKVILEELKKLDYETDIFEISEENIGDLKKLEPDLFFNYAFGIGSIPKSEVDLANILEGMGILFTGSTARAIALTTDKALTKDVLRANNLPTPGETKFPLIVKPKDEDCSLGITESSVVMNAQELEAQVNRLKELYSEEVLVEEYIDGRELNVTILGNGENAVVLPVSEIIFGDKYPGKYKIVDFDAKWEEQTDSFKETNGVCPADLPKNLLEEINRVSKKAYEVTGCRDYARVDIRLSADNTPYILEVNANPGIGPTDGATRSAKAFGLTYSQFLEKIVQNALSR